MVKKRYIYGVPAGQLSTTHRAGIELIGRVAGSGSAIYGRRVFYALHLRGIHAALRLLEGEQRPLDSIRRQRQSLSWHKVDVIGSLGVLILRSIYAYGTQQSGYPLLDRKSVV